ncbi:hypothetical protein AAFO92_07940 [Roseovarius sp. CAU 1744]|uniref:hypothetical protein n=1 Tax=Roseovarius sp. CAU 1744 TaxID=3140368 RepID=UPI00325C020E
MPVFRSTTFLCGALIACATTASAASYKFQSLHLIGEELGYDNAKPTIADNGTVVFLDIRDFATDERIIAVDAALNKTTLLDSGDPVTPLNVVGPGISDDGKFVAFMARQTVPGSFPVDRIYRVEATGGPLVLIAEPGQNTTGDDRNLNPVTIPIGAASCRGNCSVSEEGALFGGSGSVMFSTLSSSANSTVSYGSGGTGQIFAEDDEIGFHDSFHQSGNGFKMAVLTYGGEQEVRAGLIGFQNSVKWIDTSGQYDAFRSVNINDQINTAVIAERDLGGEEILAFLGTAGSDPSVFSTFASTDGAFGSFSDLSLGDNKNLVFKATLDTPGSGEAIFVGADPVKNRVVGPGDKILNRTVLAVDLAPADAVNGAGTFAFAVRFTNGTSRIVKASRIKLNFLPEALAQLSTLGESRTMSLSTLVDVPRGMFDLSFEYNLLQSDGLLEVFLGNNLLGSFTAIDNGLAMINDIDPFALFGSSLPARALLDFRLSGGPDVTIQLDNVVMPGLLNGDFETGYFDGWRPNANGGAIAVVATRPSIIPLPSSAGLLLSAVALAGLGAGFRRRYRRN